MLLKTFLKENIDKGFYDLLDVGHAIMFPIKGIKVENKNSEVTARIYDNDRDYIGELVYISKDTEFKENIRRDPNKKQFGDKFYIGFLTDYFPVYKGKVDPREIYNVKPDELFIVICFYAYYYLPIFKPDIVTIETLKGKIVGDKFNNIPEIKKLMELAIEKEGY